VAPGGRTLRRASSTTRPTLRPRSHRPRSPWRAASIYGGSQRDQKNILAKAVLDPMNFTLSDDQRMLQDTVERLVARSYGFEQRKGPTRQPVAGAAASGAPSPRSDCWLLPFPESTWRARWRAHRRDAGDASTRKALPLGAAAVDDGIGAAALRWATDAQLDHWVGAIAAGELTLAWAHREAQSRIGLHDVECSAQRVTGGWL